MNSPTKTLEQQIKELLPAGGFNVEGGNDWYMEVKDTETGLVWMSSTPVQPADFEASSLDETLVKVGVGRSTMDRAAFQYSPGAPNKPVRERFINGRHYINVASVHEMIPPTEPNGPMEIMVNKAHVIGFEAGRSVSILSLPQGDFVELIGDSAEDDTRILPAGGSLKQIELTDHWVVPLPTPTRTFFWFGGSMRSFQGPVALPDSV